MYQKIVAIGHLGQDPELKELESGKKVCKISVATSENYPDGNGGWTSKTTWHNVIGWGNLAQGMADRLKKGHLVFVEGQINHRTTGEGENKRYYTDLVARTFRKLEKSENNSFPSEADAPPAREPVTATENTSTSSANPDDDLPF